MVGIAHNKLNMLASWRHPSMTVIDILMGGVTV